MKYEMIWQCNLLHECKQISMRSFVAAVLLETGRIDFGVATLSERGASSDSEFLRRKSILKALVGRMSVLGAGWAIFSAKSFAWHTMLFV